MDSGLLWTVVGTVTAVIAAGLTAWQVRLQLVEHRQSRQLRARAEQGRSRSPMAFPSHFRPAGFRPRYEAGTACWQNYDSRLAFPSVPGGV